MSSAGNQEIQEGGLTTQVHCFIVILVLFKEQKEKSVHLSMWTTKWAKTFIHSSSMSDIMSQETQNYVGKITFARKIITNFSWAHPMLIY